ncbi:MAG: general secretion pathway protein GspK [Deltaproteobacteria bacterium]|nr:MAG: general secretion pathway protein GspK [Deltaproteobacteria bacterium]
MNNILQSEKGAALVVTLAIVGILIAAALQLGKYTGDSVMGTLKGKDMFQAEQLALSGIELAKLILSEDAAENESDSVQEAWADPDKLSQAVSQLGLEQDVLTIKITDELSKIQVNALILEFPGNQLNPDQFRIWENLLRLRFSDDKAVDERDPAEIINSMKDWLDSEDDDAISGISGAESDYYLDLDPPYTCTNGPFNHIDELFSVKGISKDLLKNENPDDPDEIDEEVVAVEIGDIFTVYGLGSEKTENGGYRYPGKVNINTADVEVLAALLPEGMEDLAYDLVDYRGQKSEEGDVFVYPLDKGWYKQVIELSEKEQKRFDRVITYSSNIFKVDCTAQENDASVTLVAFLKREKHKESGKWMCRTIQMERK